MPGRKIDDVLSIFGERLNHEHTLIANRMSWLMALNGFLTAALGISIANSSSIPHASLALITTGVACLGAVSNASCLFSNYWGSRAIQEMALALHQVLRRPEYREDLDQSWASLRLYGKDPDNPPLPPNFWRPPSKFLHPWHLLPAIFGIAYLLVPIIGLNRTISNRPEATPQALNAVLAIAPTVITGILFIPPILMERRWRAIVSKQREEDLSWRGIVPDLKEYERSIGPYIAALSEKSIMRMLVCSVDEARAIRRGAFIPHERHWEELKAAIEASRR